MKYILVLILTGAVIAILLAGCTTPSQWCVGQCTQTNPVEHVAR